jgi:hypothetical protein
MKGKTFQKKMLLNKKTIANLTTNLLDAVKGGKPPTMFTYCLYTCTGQPCGGWETFEFRTCRATCETFACGECTAW